MGYALLWLESLAAGLLLLAATVACAARLKRRWVRVVLSAAAGLGLAAAGAAVTLVTATLEERWETTRWFGYSLSWAVGVSLGALLLIAFGLRSRGEKLMPGGREWPRGKLLLAGLAAVALLLATFWNMDAAVRLQLAALRAEAGALALSVTPARIPDRDNAAPLYEEAFEILLPQSKWPPEWQAKSTQWFAIAHTASPQALNWDDPDLVKFLARQAPGLELVRRAAAKPDCFFEKDYSPRPDTLIPETQHMRGCALALSLEARVQAARGNLAAALTNVAAILRMARHAGTNPFLIGFLVSVAIETIGRDTLEKVLAQGQPTAADLAVLRDLEPVHYRQALRRSLKMEEALGLSMFVMASEGDVAVVEGRANEDEPAFAVGAALWRLFYLPEDLDGYRQWMRQFGGSLLRPYADGAESDAQLARPEASIPRGYISRMLIPASAKVTHAAARGDVSRRLVLLGTAVAEYRAREGHYPAKVDDLVPKYLAAVPTDPYSGKPLRMVADADGVAVYSVGPDLKDDGGRRISVWTGRPPSGDVTLRIGKADVR